MDNIMNAKEWKLHAFTQNLGHKINLLNGAQDDTSPSWTDILVLSLNPSSGRGDSEQMQHPSNATQSWAHLGHGSLHSAYTTWTSTDY